ncbi:MAG: hypothetical protein J5676_03930 [Bacteroidaceae bacterium]|nr:hypothetical protein [Bacteroidaceae bacterium]
MRLKSVITMVFASVALLVGTTSCGDDDDDKVVSAAEAMAGEYNGELGISVMGTEVKSEGIFKVTKADGTHIDLTLPAAGEGAMALPSLDVKNIQTTAETEITVGDQKVKAYTATLDSYSGTITVNGEEKAYTITNLSVAVTGNACVITYTLKYGKMPMAMSATFQGTKK